jgi:hypothetical protein
VIPGYFDSTSTWPVPRVRAAVFVPGYSTKWGLVEFLLDTGAATTVLHPRDAIVAANIGAGLLVDPTRWPNQRNAYGVGGTSINYILLAHYGFMHDNGQWETFLAEIAVAQLTVENQTLPSLLGWDILQKYRVDADWASREVRLHGAPPQPPPAVTATPLP